MELVRSLRARSENGPNFLLVRTGRDQRAISTISAGRPHSTTLGGTQDSGLA